MNNMRTPLRGECWVLLSEGRRGVSCNRQVGAALLLVGPVERLPRVALVLVKRQRPLRKTSARKAPCERERERERARARRGEFWRSSSQTTV